MTSVHHHPSSDVGLHHVPDWVWIGLAALLAVAFGLGIGYMIGNQDAETTGASATAVDGFAYDNESTPMHIATQPGVTTPYMGNSGVLYPDPIAVAPIMGLEVANESTSMHLLSGLVTTEYFGNSGELYPAPAVLASASGFDYDHDSTPMHIKSTSGVTTTYFGNSGELFADD
ncbi:MAG: hypothetical protein ACR2N9_03545 [Acidimicrobiia bacterium]